jgi:cobalt-zinc-cadmium efflux system membrane fusion protein
MSLWKTISLCAMLLSGVGLIGCGQSPDTAAATIPATTQVSTEGHSDEGWWCEEHGVPEEVCALCNIKLVGDFKAKGDWCKEHDRPDSQCFICHPEKEAEFAAQYEAKYGKKPPKPQGAGVEQAHREHQAKS